jgi:hypothetical protein
MPMPTTYAGKNIFPLAYIDGILYFTNEEETATLDNRWGSGTMFAAKIENLAASAKRVDTATRPNTVIFKFTGPDHKTIKTKEYGSIIQKASKGVIDTFIEHCRQSKKDLNIKYQDEHLKSVLGMITTLQVIEHIVKQAKCDFSLEFFVEKYSENKNYIPSVTSNLLSDRDRDDQLQSLTNEWLDSLKSDYNIEGKLEPIQSKEWRTLTHWRVLSITCGSKTLHIYPDGGFINGWYLNRGGNNRYYEVEDTNTTDNISIVRNEEIKFDVCIEDA